MASLYEKLKKRRQAMDKGDPTGGEAVETKQTKENKRKVRRETKPQGTPNSEAEGSSERRQNNGDG